MMNHVKILVIEDPDQFVAEKKENSSRFSYVFSFIFNKTYFETEPV